MRRTNKPEKPKIKIDPDKGFLSVVLEDRQLSILPPDESDHSVYLVRRQIVVPYSEKIGHERLEESHLEDLAELTK